MTDAGGWDHVTASFLDGARRGDQEAWRRLFDRVQSAIWWVARVQLAQTNLLDRFDPDDVVQETVLVAFRRISTFTDRGPGSFRVWLGQIARNIVREWHRNENLVQKRKHDRAAVDLDRQVAVTATPEEEVEKRWMTERVVRAVAAIPEPAATLISYYAYLGLTWAELADAMSTAADRWTAARARYQVNAAIGLVVEALVDQRSASDKSGRGDASE